MNGSGRMRSEDTRFATVDRFLRRAAPRTRAIQGNGVFEAIRCCGEPGVLGGIHCQVGRAPCQGLRIGILGERRDPDPTEEAEHQHDDECPSPRGSQGSLLRGVFCWL